MNTYGIGLGLVIAKEIINMFDGDISCVSEFEVGSTFTFTIKLGNENYTEIEAEDSSDLPS